MTIFEMKHFKPTERITRQENRKSGSNSKHCYYQYFNYYLIPSRNISGFEIRTSIFPSLSMGRSLHAGKSDFLACIPMKVPV